MIGIKKVVINDIPTLFVTKITEKKQLPTLIYYHGFTSGKENNLTIAYLMAEKGYRVILPECLYHGERHNEVSDEALQLAFWDIVIQSIQELQSIKVYLDEHSLLLNNRIGVAGTSMGGMITAGALAVYPWIKLGGLLMSTSKLTSFAHGLIAYYNEQHDEKVSDKEKEQVIEQLQRYDLYEKINQLNDRPLYIWHGLDDKTVPFQHATKLVKKIETSGQSMDNITFIEERNRAHHLSRLAIKEATKHFTTYL